MKKVMWIVLNGLVLHGATEAASFDCAKAQTEVEKTICANVELTKLDEELAVAYKAALKDQKQAEFVRQTQKLWMAERNYCQDVDCLKTAYGDRISVLVKIKSGPTAKRGEWTYHDGAGRKERLCRNLLVRLNLNDRDEGLESRCSFSVIASYPGFSAPPWEELDPKAHEDLLVKLLKYSGEDPVGYFQLRPEVKPRNTDSYYQSSAKRIIEEGGRLRVWRTRLVNHFGTGPIVTAPPGEQSIVQMYLPMPKENQGIFCPGKPKPTRLNSVKLTYIFTGDLSGPEPLVDRGTFGVLNGRDLVIYNGQPLLIGSEDVWQDGPIMLERVCNFDFISGEK